MSKTKECSGCGGTFPITDFTKNRTKRDGHNSRCKECRSKYHKRYYSENADKIKARARKWYADNTEYAKEYRRQHYIDHAEEYKERAAQYLINNAEAVREYERRRYPTRKEDVKRRTRHYVAWSKGAIGEWSQEQWDTLRQMANGRCMCCGKGEMTMDHIVPLSRGGSNWIINIQVLCTSCNASKGNRHSTDYRSSKIAMWARFEMWRYLTGA